VNLGDDETDPEKPRLNNHFDVSLASACSRKGGSKGEEDQIQGWKGMAWGCQKLPSCWAGVAAWKRSG
jgi:hypothetical protein